ncbi:uncharacterized protein A4U43_C03F22090 [Asparagus officinalis]|uniref:Uncharacterized protein n=1 Tax=Asparagus officinalis TaxID=4686 RepID=A0A5P1FCV4_ASPOF|nr:uncharacterized protein A4U43_C03F22090 [Asparagus officinalis]
MEGKISLRVVGKPLSSFKGSCRDQYEAFIRCEGELPISPVADPLVCPPKPTNSAVIQAPQNPSQPSPADLKGKRPMIAETPSPVVSSPPVEVEGNPDSVEVLLKGAKVSIDKSLWELFKSVFDAADYVLIDPPSTEGDKLFA